MRRTSSETSADRVGVPAAGIEPATYGLGNRRSIRLSYASGSRILRERVRLCNRVAPRPTDDRSWARDAPCIAGPRAPARRATSLDAHSEATASAISAE